MMLMVLLGLALAGCRQSGVVRVEVRVHQARDVAVNTETLADQEAPTTATTRDNQTTLIPR